ncbi:hypothetical protein ACFL1B_01070 [Nanoarchaeota archaeon]
MRRILILLTILLIILLVACKQVPDTNQPVVKEEAQIDRTGPYVEIMKFPDIILSGNTYEYAWDAKNGKSIKRTQIQAAHTEEFSTIIEETFHQNNGPGTYKSEMTLVAPQNTTFFLRAYAQIDGQDHYSPAVSMLVAVK